MKRTGYLIICVILVFFLLMLYGVNDITIGFSREEYNCTFECISDENVVLRATAMCEDNELCVYEEYEILKIEDVESIEWNIQYSESANTWQLYLQALNPIVFCTRAYELTGNNEYLQWAESLINEWDEYRKSELADNNSFVWYDHGVALRTDNLIYFFLVAKEAGYLSQDSIENIANLIMEHADWLADTKNYTLNHNHGIFQDQALMYCAFLFPEYSDSERWETIFKERLIEQEEFAFSEEMVHVENSPAYQVGVMELFNIIADFLSQFDDDYGEYLKVSIKEAAEFMAFMTKPDGMVPMVGDTYGIDVGLIKYDDSVEVFDNEHLTWACTQGDKGEMPENNSVIYPESGYYLSHNSWQKENYTEATWQMFKAGYLSKTHKHADDNSFSLFSKGYDVFVDSGMYNYMQGNRYRDYFVSSLAHNVIVVDGKTYSPTLENADETGIYDYSLGRGYDYILGYNEQYEGVSWDRHYYNLGDAIFIWDNIESDESHLYSQLFHTSEVMKIVEKKDDETLFELADTGYFVRVKQYNTEGNNEIIRGDFENSIYGYISRKPDQIEPINTLRYGIEGDNVDFYTMITIEDKFGTIENISGLNVDIESKHIVLNNYEEGEFLIELIKRDRIKAQDCVVEIVDNNAIKCQNRNELKREVIQYAWYIIDKDTASVVEKTSFSEEPLFEYKFNESGNYLIKAYVRNETDTYRKNHIIAEICVGDNTISIKPFEEFVYIGHSFQKVGSNIYKFEVEYDYSWNTNVKWYIYRDGGYYDNFTEYDNSMQYEFTEEGNYTIMYYLRSSNGDCEFWNFPQISIS